MKTARQMVLACGLVGALGALGAVGAAYAQGGGAAGPGPGASGPGMGMGMGQGMQGGHGPGARAGANYTPGWSMMTPAERSEHMAHMGAIKSQDECKAYVLKHHDEMTARAKEKGAKPLAAPRRDPCAGLKP